MNEYERFSEVYDSLMYDAPGGKWAEYLIGLLPGEERMTLLEYACGSGRLTQEFLQRGHAVIGVDRSSGMLSRAEEKLRPLGRPYRLACCDMADFRLVTPADAAVCGLDAANYLTTEARLKAFLEGAAANLREGAPLLFDISTPCRIAGRLGNEFYYDDGDEQTLFWQNNFDEETGLLEMNLTVFVAGDRGRYRRIDEQHVIRAWTDGEIRSALAETGFTGVEAFAFGTTDPPGESCERVQYRAFNGTAAAGA